LTDEVLEAGRLFFAAGIILPQRLWLRLWLWGSGSGSGSS